MKRYERVLVCIDWTEQAPRMLAYVQAIARWANSKDIRVLRIADDQAGDAGDGLPEPSDTAELTVETLRDLVSEHLKEDGKETCRCEVVRGTPLLEVLRYAHDKDVDLIVIGRHYRTTGETDDQALLARRITRKSSCSVLVVPDESQIKSDTILVPVRDSECSANALDVACGIAAATGAAVVALNVYQVHTGYSRVGTTFEEHRALLKAAAERECERLIKRVDTRAVEVTYRCAADVHNRPVPIVLEALASVSADLVVIGARGRSGAAGVLLGNVTERLISESPLPVLAVKKKGECLGILRALLTLAGEG